jgi:hypothetical protein
MRILMQRASVALVGFTLAVTTFIGDAHAGDVLGYRTDTVVPSNHKECVGVPGCVSTSEAGVVVPARGRKSGRFACPASHPNLWAWDAAQHEHIMVQVVALDRATATIEGVNATNVAGQYMVSLGCSTEPYKGTGFQKSRQLAPTATMVAERAVPRRPSPSAPVAADNPCDGYKECEVQPQVPFAMNGWETTTQSYTCQSPYPFVANATYTQSGSPSVSVLAVVAEEYPGTEDMLLTNWNLFATDVVWVSLACSKINSFGGTCGAPQSNPGCPTVAGSSHNYCSRGPVPVCIQTFEERCAANNQLYSCTTDLLVTWCSPCPG